MYLFPRKHVLVKVELKLFIGYVDAQLLKGICSEIFKPKDVQNANVSHVLYPAVKIVVTWLYALFF